MHNDVKEYYGKVLQHSDDLKTDACCTAESIPGYLKDILSELHDEVMSKYYGCGIILPESIEGKTILDLGSGSGRDCYVLSKLVGEKGKVIGVDMTDEQLDVANRHIGYHTEKFGYTQPNIEFKKGYIEELDKLDIPAGSVDIIVSNCVINLSPDKKSVLKHAFDLLKPGGEIYFSDVYSDRKIPKPLQEDPILYGECLSGALYWKDFLDMAVATGFKDARLVKDRVLDISNESIQDLIGHINFYSATYRLFKIEELESQCEDYGQAVIYKGGIQHHNEVFHLDGHHAIQKGKVFPVCGNTWRMLHDTRFKEYFEFIGTWDTHYGAFSDCGINVPFGSAGQTDSEGACC
ncbi:MAG: methyltransferase domain-containing protein [Fibrobacterales bacterium]